MHKRTVLIKVLRYPCWTHRRKGMKKPGKQWGSQRQVGGQ